MRPAAIQIFGILNLVFGALSLCGVAITAPMLFLDTGRTEIAIGTDHPFYRYWTYFSVAISIPLTIQLIAAGIGLLRMRRWGLTLSIWYAIIDLIVIGLGMGFMTIYVVLPLLEQDLSGSPIIAGAIGGLIGSGISFIYPALMWYFLSRPHVVAAFAGGATYTVDQSASNPAGHFDPALAAAPTPVSSNPYVAPAPSLERYVPPPPGQYPAGDEALTTLVPVRNPSALTSYYLGVFSLIPCLGIPLAIAAIVCGVYGLRAARRAPQVKGRGHAIAGITLGSVVLAGTLLLVALVVIAQWT